MAEALSSSIKFYKILKIKLLSVHLTDVYLFVQENVGTYLSHATKCVNNKGYNITVEKTIAIAGYRTISYLYVAAVQ